MHAPATPPGLANAADVLSGQLRAHLGKLFLLLRPQTAQIDRRFRSWLRGRRYDARQVKALCGITPTAAAALMDKWTPAAFFEQVEYHGRRLAKLDVTPEQVIDALRHYDVLLDPALRRLRPAAARDLEWARSQLQFCIVLALNNAFYQVRETEARTFYELADAGSQAGSLEDLIGRYLQILKEFCRADAARLKLFPAGAEPTRRIASGLVRSRFLDGASGRQWVLDASLRRRYRCFWSIPLLREGHLAGVMQFGFSVQYSWLPRELQLLTAAAERCLRAAERVKLTADLAGREEQVRRLGEHMMRIEEEERRRISRELHDETGQSLLCIRLQLELLERLAPDGLRARVVEIRELSEHTIIEIRRIIAALSPAVLEQLGLAAALRQLTNRFRSLHPGRVRLQISARLPRLSRETETTAYRLVQECYHNIAKHSEAATVNISLRSTDELLRLSVNDDGVGFETGKAPGRNSTGLTGMKERVALLGGRFEIRSRLHHGTTIRADLPLGTIKRQVKSAGKAALKRKQDVI